MKKIKIDQKYLPVHRYPEFPPVRQYKCKPEQLPASPERVLQKAGLFIELWDQI